MNPPPYEGEILLIDKPLRWTSFDAVKKIRHGLFHHLRSRGQAPGKVKNLKVGHAGTLDPLATGLLVICTGKMTGKIAAIQDAEKEYTGTIVLGATTASFDLETEVTGHCDIRAITEEQVREAVRALSGKQVQVPPAHSAIKIDGQRAYEKARKGEEVEIKGREIEIKVFDISAIRFPEVDFRVVCTKGTYIRSLARDLGEKLGCGAYLSALCRTRIGEYRLENARDPQTFLEQLPE